MDDLYVEGIWAVGREWQKLLEHQTQISYTAVLLRILVIYDMSLISSLGYGLPWLITPILNKLLWKTWTTYMWMRVTWFCITGHLTNISSWRDKINQIQMTLIRKAEFYIILNNASNNNWHWIITICHIL